MPSDAPSPDPIMSMSMSTATKDVLARVRQMIPPMLEKFHKGQLGRVAVIGGSEDYTGAPYFSAMASARLGCDMVCFVSPFFFLFPSLSPSPSRSVTPASLD